MKGIRVSVLECGSKESEPIYRELGIVSEEDIMSFVNDHFRVANFDRTVELVFEGEPISLSLSKEVDEVNIIRYGNKKGEPLTYQARRFTGVVKEYVPDESSSANPVYKKRFKMTGPTEVEVDDNLSIGRNVTGDLCIKNPKTGFSATLQEDGSVLIHYIDPINLSHDFILQSSEAPIGSTPEL